MAFEPKKFNDIFEDMRGRTTALTDFEVGSVTRTILESFSFEMGLLYQKMSLVYLSGFVDTATGSHLDNVVAVLGIQRGLPDFAVGKVTFKRDKGNAEVTIPVGTLVATEEKPNIPKKAYTTLEVLLLEKDQQEATVAVQAVERGPEKESDIETIVVMPRPIVGIKSVTNTEKVKLIGRRRETDDELRRRAKNALLASGKATISALENAVLALSGVFDVKIIEEFTPEQKLRFGMVKVVVDASDYNKIYDTLFKTVEAVRAAGVYAKIEEAKKIKLNGTFRIEALNAQNLSDEGHLKLEQQVKSAIEDFLREIKMGNPLSISKLMKAILAVDGVDNLANYDLSATKRKEDNSGDDIVDIKENKIKAGELERFAIGAMFVASEDKVSKLSIEFKATDMLTPSIINTAKTNINTYLNKLAAGTLVTIEQIITELKKDVSTLTNSIITIHSWTNPTVEAPFNNNYKISFVEKLTVDKFFGYNHLITIESALLLTVADATKLTTTENVRRNMTTYLNALPPKAPIVLAKLLDIVKKTENVLDAEWSEADFMFKSDGAPTDKKIVNGEIAINEFEKPALSNGFLIGTKVSDIPVTFSIGIKIPLPHSYTPADEARVKAVLTNSLTAFLATFKNGQKLNYLEVQDHIQNTDIGFSFKIEALEATVNGVTATLTTLQDFKFTVLQRAVLTTATITIVAEPQPV